MSRFASQSAIRGPWRKYLDRLCEHQPGLHRYGVRLTGNVWDSEDLMQDTLARVFSMLGKIDSNVEHPRAYLICTAGPARGARKCHQSLDRPRAALGP